MDDIPLYPLAIGLAACLLSSAFFSGSETAMMAINRYKLANKVKQGHRAAIRTQLLLNQTEKLLSVILLGNTIINTASATLSALIATRLFTGNEIAIGISAVITAFVILVFSEATPKVIAATYPEKFAFVSSAALVLLLRLFYPAVWFVNLFVTTILRLLHLRQAAYNQQALSPEELRILVLESGKYIQKKHHAVLLNLLELGHITVDDVMTPRHQMEMVDLKSPADELRRQLFTCHHSRLPVYEDDPDNVLGMLHVRKVLSLKEEEIDSETIGTLVRSPHFIPSGTPLFTQLQNFQESQRRIGMVVDEYGELLGLVTLEDILEQIIGEFTTNAPQASLRFEKQPDSSYLLDGATSLRELNRKLKLALPIDGPKTLNGLILEYFEEIPDTGTCFVLAGERLEIVQTQDRSIRMVRLYPHA